MYILFKRADKNIILKYKNPQIKKTEYFRNDTTIINLKK